MTEAVTASAEARTEKAKNDPNNIRLWGLFSQRTQPKASDFRDFSGTLNSMGITTSTGLPFTPERARTCYNNLRKIFSPC